MTENADDVLDVAGRNVAAAAMVASRAAEPIAAALQQRAVERTRQHEVETRRTQRELEAQRRLMHAELRPVLTPTWWNQDATPDTPAAAWHLANAWRSHDELAATAATAIEHQAPERFGRPAFDLALTSAATAPERTVTERVDGTLSERAITEAEALTIIECPPALNDQGPAHERTDPHDMRRWNGIATDVDQAIAAKFPQLTTPSERDAARPDVHGARADASSREQRDQHAIADRLLSEAARTEHHDQDRTDGLHEQAQTHQDLATSAADAAAQHEDHAHLHRVDAITASVEGLDPQAAQGRIVAAKGSTNRPAAAARVPRGATHARKASGRGQRIARQRDRGL